MFVLKKTIDVHGEGLKGAGSDALAAVHSSLPELRSQIEIDSATARPAMRSNICSVLQQLSLVGFVLQGNLPGTRPN